MNQRATLTPVTTDRVLQRKCACGTGESCEACGKKKELQRKATGPTTGEVPDVVYDVLRSPGQPLDAATRAYMEPRFGHDFSRVRIHTDGKAAASARAVNADAYTVGQQIVFAPARYAPHDQKGRGLIAHELTHTLQQTGRCGPIMLGDSNSPLEGDAEKSAEGVLAGRAFEPQRVDPGGPALRRQDAGDSPLMVFNSALSNGEWDSAVRALAEMSDADARAGLAALTSEARAHLLHAASRLDPSPNNREVRLIEAAEQTVPAAPARPAAAAEDLSGLSATEKLGRAWNYATRELDRAIVNELASLFSPESLAIMAGFLVAYVAAQLTPAGWVADGIALASLTVAFFFMGRVLLDIVEKLIKFGSAINATTDAQLRASGHALAEAIARGGVQLIIILLTRGMSGKGRGGSRYDSPPPTRGGDAVLGTGRIVRVPEAAMPEIPGTLQFAGAGPSLPPPPRGFRGPVPGTTRPGRAPVRRPVEPIETPAEPAPISTPNRPPVSRGPEPVRPTEPTQQPHLGDGTFAQNAPLVVPLTKQPKPSDPCPFPTGLTPGDPIPIVWYKVAEYYPNPIMLQGIEYQRDSQEMLPDGGDLIGVPGRYWPSIGKIVQLVPDSRGGEAARFRERLQQFGFDWGARRYLQADHVQDLQWGRPDGTPLDTFENLWPIDGAANASAGSRQNNWQQVSFCETPDGPPVTMTLLEMKRYGRGGRPYFGRYFAITRIEI